MLKIITLNERVEEEAATKPDILYFFGQGNFLSGKSQGILKRDVCGNRVDELPNSQDHYERSVLESAWRIELLIFFYLSASLGSAGSHST